MELSKKQIEVLNGHLLGDGCLVNPGKQRKNSYLKIVKKSTDVSYLLWSKKQFSNLVKNTETFSIHGPNSIEFFTRCLPVFTEYRKIWYPEGKKIVPKDLILTPLTIAVWFADDGNVHSYTTTRLNASFATHCFSYNEILFLQTQLFDLYDINTKIYKEKNKEQYQIFINKTKECKKLFRIIDEYFPLYRKAKIWRAQLIDLWDKNIPFCKFCQSKEYIRKRGKSKLGKQQYFCKKCNKSFIG